MPRGHFIVIEGMDGSGKSTLAKQLGEILTQNGFPVWVTAEPTKDQYGLILREKLHDTTIHPVEESLLFALDRFHHSQQITDSLNKGMIVISDRYKPSSYAYQLVTFQQYKYPFIDTYRWIERINTHSPEPEVMVYLQITPEHAMERIVKMGKPLEKYENLVFLQSLSINYDNIMRLEKSKYPILSVSVTDDLPSLVTEVYRKLFRYIGEK